MNNLPKKNSFLGLFYSFRKKKISENFVEENFQFEPFFVEKTQFENSIFLQQHFTFRLISSQKTGKLVFLKNFKSSFLRAKGLESKKPYYKVVSFCDTNKIRPKNLIRVSTFHKLQTSELSIFFPSEFKKNPNLSM
jgi:hypothetical protein